MMSKMIAVSLAVAGGLLVAAAPAQAHVSFSLGIEAPLYAPPPVYYEPPPVYYPPPPVYYRPPPTYYGPPGVVYSTAPRYYAPPAYYRQDPRFYRPRGEWDGGYDRRDDEHRRWHEEHRYQDRRDDQD